MTHDSIPQPLPSAPPLAYVPPMPPSPAAPLAAPPLQPARDAKVTAIAIALFGAAALALVGLVTKSWFTVPNGGLGLTGIEACMGGKCMSIALSDVPNLPGDIPLFAWLGLVSGLAAVAAAGAMGGMLLAGKAAKIPLKAVSFVLGIAAFSTTMFLMRVFNDDPKHLSFGWSGFTAIGALVVIGALTKVGVTPRVKATA